MPIDPRTAFPQFYDNPAIRALATACRWTISGQIGDLESADSTVTDDAPVPTRKAPIDVRHLIDFGRVRGAWSISEACLVTLPELSRGVPMAANTAFYLQAQADGLIVIDIEPGCPPEIAMDLLRLPGILYSEVSMSGQGYHLIAAAPENFHEFPVAAGKRVLREENGYYEILLDHWATFTRSPIPAATLEQAQRSTAPQRFATVEALYAELAALARNSVSVSSAGISTDSEMPDIPYGAAIVANTLANSEGQLRDPEHFNHDMSRWEFSVLGSLYGWLRTQLTAFGSFDVDYDTADQTWLLYEVARQIIPFRAKHAQIRNGRPYLLDRAAALVAAREAAEERARSEASAST